MTRESDTAHARVIFGDARQMIEVDDETIHLVITSPPYWQIKDYAAAGQIGYGQSLHDYLLDLSRTWRECWRVLKPGRRLCVNVGDQFARATIYGRYKIIPIHAEIIAQCEAIGFDYMGSIIWQKKTTMQTSGGAVIMGSFPHPPNGIVELDYEYILLFKKPGEVERIPATVKAASKLTKDEWKAYFQGHWQFGGTRQVQHEAMFPDELPRRLIRMFSFVGETVLDPFLGSGTTAKVALELDRNAVGFEMQTQFETVIREKLKGHSLGAITSNLSIEQRRLSFNPVASPDAYRPQVQDIKTVRAPKSLQRVQPSYKVTEIRDEKTVQLNNASLISLLGIKIPRAQRAKARDYLNSYILGKQVFIKDEQGGAAENLPTPAYLYLTNKIFINRKMIEMRLAVADLKCQHRFKEKFLEAEANALQGASQ